MAKKAGKGITFEEVPQEIPKLVYLEEKPKVITVEDLYNHEIHGITFTILERALGAKIYKNGETGAELRMNFDGNVKKIHLSFEELKQMRENINFLYDVAYAKHKLVCHESLS